MIERTEIMSNTDLINWLEVLSKGYVKPDSAKRVTANTTGIVRETKDYVPFIMLVNSELCRRAGLNCPSVEGFTEFKEKETLTSIKRV